jgi:hypothetical protein
MPAWTPLSHRWCCARCPTKPAPWLNSSRDTLTAITTAGFHLTSTHRFRFPDSRLPSPATPHVLGIARRPPESRPEGRHRID